MFYTQEEDKIIVRNLKECSRKGAPLNIQDALNDARKEIRFTLKRKRSLASVSVRWYKYLRHTTKVWGVDNMKNRSVKAGLQTFIVKVGKQEFRLDANLRPTLINHLKKVAAK